MASSSRETSSIPQAQIDAYWTNFNAPPDESGPVMRTLPWTYPISGDSYEAARESCRLQVANIVEECQRTNQKFTDQDFDIASHEHCRPCLFGLNDWTTPKRKERKTTPQPPRTATKSISDTAVTSLPHAANMAELGKDDYPKSIHRVPWIFGEIRKTQPCSTVQHKDGNLAKSLTKNFGPHNSFLYRSALHRRWSESDLQTKTSDLAPEPTLTPPDVPAHSITVEGKESDESLHRDRRAAFFTSRFSHADIKQGHLGNCWWLSGVAAVCSVNLLERICVAWDEDSGVYGFVFHKDGDWIWVVVDDQLYLLAEEFDTTCKQKDPSGRLRQQYRETYQSGSSALYFAHCADEKQFWLPLLEKAYAKAHGDYKALQGGQVGEAIEDLTGGINTRIDTSSIRDKEALWKQLSVSGDYLFTAMTFPSGNGSDYHDNQIEGLASGHAYSIESATEERNENGDGTVRLVRMRNPWGQRDSKGEGMWDGAWSDGSKEWTSYWIWKMKRKFDDDGVFYMNFDDLLAFFPCLDKTRLFCQEGWEVTKEWVTVKVPWVDDDQEMSFAFHLSKPSNVVLALSKLDTRYFRGLEGRYDFDLDFDLYQIITGEEPAHVRSAYKCTMACGLRSISMDIDRLPAGAYEVRPKVTLRRRDLAWSIYDERAMKHTVKQTLAYWTYRDDNHSAKKLLQVCRNYDDAHQKAYNYYDLVSEGGHQAIPDKHEQTRIVTNTLDRGHAPFDAWCTIGFRVNCRGEPVKVTTRNLWYKCLTPDRDDTSTQGVDKSKNSEDKSKDGEDTIMRNGS